MDNLLRVKEGILGVLEARGLTVPDDIRDDFMETDEDRYIFSFENNNYVVLYRNGKIGKAEIDTLVEYKNDPRNVVFIVGESLTPNGKTLLAGAIRNSDISIELWIYRELLVNPLTNAMAPKYKILTEEEKLKEITPLRKGNTEFVRSMEGFHEDPAMKWLGAKVGDIIRIDRYNNYMRHRITSYRVVRKLLTF